MNQIPQALGAMASYAQFMIYQLVPSATRPGKTDKFPCDVSGSKADPHDPKNWVTADTACAEATRRGTGWGVAFVLTENDPFFFIDIDDCLVNGAWSPIANELCQQFAGAAVEVSQSGRGLHILGTGSPTVSTDNRRKKAHTVVDGKKVPIFDLYTELRFIALTGTSVVGDVASAKHQHALDVMVNRYLRQDEVITATEWTTTHKPSSCPIEDDARLIEKAMSGKGSVAQMFGQGKATFKDLWTNNVSVFPDSYPPDQLDDGENYDMSKVDAALAQHLMFWCGGNCERVERLMRLSALKRDKWDSHRSYMQRTITGAAARQTTYYSVGAPIEITQPVELSAPVARTGIQLIAGSQLCDMFKDFIYVANQHRILTPDGLMLEQGQFNATYGGYIFALDDTIEKTTKKAWEAFTESQAYTFCKVFDIMYDPDTPFGSIITEDGIRYVNAFKPSDDMGTPGDVSVYTNHVAKLLPFDHNQLLDWIAYKVQNPGKCMLWAPVIIGTYGNGKTTIADAVIMMMGRRHTTIVQSSDVDNKFNGWVFGNTFAVINDFKVGDKRDVIEILKPLVTDRMIAYQKKGVDSDTCRNMLGLIITSNHRDAIIKTRDDRRYATFITHQANREELERDGLNAAHFEALERFMTNPQSISHLRYYFLNRKVAHHPNRAPDTSSTALAISESRGSIEQEVMEAIEEGRPGFRGGWVSSKALDTLLVQLRAGSRVPPAKRRDMMRSLGYDWHPALKDGRVNNALFTDGGSKPRLYIREGHLCLNVDTPSEVARQYEAAQGDPVAVAAVRNG